ASDIGDGEEDSGRKYGSSGSERVAAADRARELGAGEWGWAEGRRTGTAVDRAAIGAERSERVVGGVDHDDRRKGQPVFRGRNNSGLGWERRLCVGSRSEDRRFFDDRARDRFFIDEGGDLRAHVCEWTQLQLVLLRRHAGESVFRV